MSAVDLGKESGHARVIGGEHISCRTLPCRLVQQEDNSVYAGGEIVALQAINGFIDAVFAEHIVNIGLYAGVEQHLYGIQRILAAVPAYGYRAAVFFAKLGKLRSHAVTGSCKIRHKVILAADFQQFLKIFVLIGVAAPAERQLIASALALPPVLVSNADMK